MTTDFDELAKSWQNTPEYSEQVIIDFDNLAASIPELAAHRKYIEENGYGFGHRAFHGVWYTLAKTLPDQFKYLEIGVHKGQSISAVELSANLLHKSCAIVGISPLDGAGGFYDRKDYAEDIRSLFEKFNGNRQPNLIKELSQAAAAKEKAKELAPFDAIYIDGDHRAEAVRQDLLIYLPFIKVGGYLITDDSANNLNLFSWAFKGWQECSDEIDKVLPPITVNNNWQYITNVMHLRLWKRLA